MQWRSPDGQQRPLTRQRSAAAWYRWFAVFGLVALIGVALAYRSANPRATLTATGDGSVPLLGSSVLSLPDLATDTSQFGQMPIVRVYYPGLPDSNAWTSGLAAANHSAVIVSFKALPKDILSGADTPALQHFFDTAPSDHAIYYSYYHEPEDNIARGQFTLTDYKAAWARVVQIADAAHNPQLRSTLILMQWDLVKASHRNWKNYLPGGGVISTLGWDAYPVGSATNVHPQLTSPKNFMGAAIAASKRVGLPYGFPEFGLSTAAGRPGWLRQVGQYIMHSGALFASYFDGNRQYPTLRLTDPASIKVWRGFVAASRAGSTTPNPLPTQHPSAAPHPSATGVGARGSPHPGRPSPGVGVSALALTPASIGVSSQASATLSFRLSQPANITVCVLDAYGRVVRTVARPGSLPGQVTISYLEHDGGLQPLQAGHYTVLVVASNAGGSGTAAAQLSVSSP